MVIRGRIVLSPTVLGEQSSGKIEVVISDNNSPGAEFEAGEVFEAVRDALVRKYENTGVAIITERS